MPYCTDCGQKLNPDGYCDNPNCRRNSGFLYDDEEPEGIGVSNYKTPRYNTGQGRFSNSSNYKPSGSLSVILDKIGFVEDIGSLFKNPVKWLYNAFSGLSNWVPTILAFIFFIFLSPYFSVMKLMDYGVLQNNWALLLERVLSAVFIFLTVYIAGRIGVFDGNTPDISGIIKGTSCYLFADTILQYIDYFIILITVNVAYEYHFCLGAILSAVLLYTTFILMLRGKNKSFLTSAILTAIITVVKWLPFFLNCIRW